MKALVQSYPPLGQVTVVQDSTVVLTSVLEISNSRAEEEWDVALWISVDSGRWSEIRLTRLGHGAEPPVLSKKPQSSSFLYFRCSFSLHKFANFTFKFRRASDESWKWVREEEGSNDGIIILSTSPTSPPDDSRPCIPDLDTEWNISSHVSQSPGTQLWSISCSLPASVGKNSTFRDITIGTPWGSFIRWFALVRHKAAWLGPRHGRSRFSSDQDTILGCFLSHHGKTMAILAVSGVGSVTTTIRENGHGVVAVHARNDSASSETTVVLISEGIDFDHAVASVMYHARTMVSETYGVSQNHNNSRAKWDSKAITGWKPEWQDGLGFCTWDSLGRQLSETKVLNAIEELARNKIQITNLIIDDNWQSLDRIGSDQSQYGWSEFEADRNAFPSGLRSVVAQIRNLHPALQNIIVWHAMLGYWGGISPNGLIAKTYSTIKVAQEGENSHPLTVVGKPDVLRLYDDFYRFLAESGIDGVKADAQVMIDMLKDAPDRRDLISTYLDVWSKTSEECFGGKTISCMSQFPYSLFHSQLPRSRGDFSVRNSDDFFPDVPRSHPWHIWANAHNAIVTQFLNAVPDWDMFQTVHSYAEFHAAARCVSGSPIYITDIPGMHNMHLIKQMTATTPLGQTVVLRPSVLGKSMCAYAGYEDGLLLKIGSYNGASQTGTGILGIFNVSTRHLAEIVPLGLFPGVFEGGKYAVRSHTTGQTSAPMTTGAPDSVIAASINEAGYEILCAFPLAQFKSGRYGNGYAGAVGLVGKMTGCAAMTYSSVVQRDSGTVIVTCNLKALGTLGVYISTLPHLNIEDDFMVAIEDQPVRFETVSRSEDDERIFEIDVERAWEEVAVSTMQRGEVQIKVSFQP